MGRVPKYAAWIAPLALVAVHALAQSSGNASIKSPASRLSSSLTSKASIHPQTALAFLSTPRRITSGLNALGASSDPLVHVWTLSWKTQKPVALLTICFTDPDDPGLVCNHQFPQVSSETRTTDRSLPVKDYKIWAQDPLGTVVSFPRIIEVRGDLSADIVVRLPK